MRYFAHIDNNGKIQGWYHEEIHNNIPNPNIEVSYEIWQEAISINANFYNKKSNKFEHKDLRTQKEIEEDKKFHELQELKEYLKDTDFYYVRLAETEEAVPQEVIDKRTQARERIRELEEKQNNQNKSGER